MTSRGHSVSTHDNVPWRMNTSAIRFVCLEISRAGFMLLIVAVSFTSIGRALRPQYALIAATAYNCLQLRTRAGISLSAPRPEPAQVVAANRAVTTCLEYVHNYTLALIMRR